MNWRPFVRNRARGLRIDFAVTPEGKPVFRCESESQGTIDAMTAYRNQAPGLKSRGELRLVGAIPAEMQLDLLWNQGIDIRKKDQWGEVKKILADRDYRKLLADPGQIMRTDRK